MTSRKKVSWKDMGVAVTVAVVFGVALGLGIGFVARSFGLSTTWIGPLTGGIVGGLVHVVYSRRTRPAADAAP